MIENEKAARPVATVGGIETSDALIVAQAGHSPDDRPSNSQRDRIRKTLLPEFELKLREGGFKTPAEALTALNANVDEVVLLEQYLHARETGARSATPVAGQPGPEIANRVPSSPNIEIGAEILDRAPEMLTRPIGVVAGRGYAATWVLGTGMDYMRRSLVVVSEDGGLYTDAAITGALALQSLGFPISLTTVPEDRLLWSGRGVKNYISGIRPNAADVFRRVVGVVDAFTDFDRSLADQTVMAEFCACWVTATYFRPAFNVFGYIWPNGERGSGKSHLISVMAACSYLGTFLSGRVSFATFRDLAHYGATLAFDDYERYGPDGGGKSKDPDVERLILTGYRNDGCVPYKAQLATGQWEQRYARSFCPKLFSAISRPDATLASRTILVPLVRSVDAAKTKVDPADYDSWPTNRNSLRDDLWATALANLSSFRRFDKQAAGRVASTGRTLEPWRNVLAVALWLDEKHGVDGLFRRMAQMLVNYADQKADLEIDDQTRLLIRALWQLVCDHSEKAEVEFETAALTSEIQSLAEDEGLTELDFNGRPKAFVTARSVGGKLGRLRVDKPGKGHGRRRWKTTRAFVQRLAEAREICLDRQEPDAADAADATGPEEIAEFEEIDL